MLRSTGFFRGLDCPFYGENKGKAGEEKCCRPYCHFRHGKQRRAASGIYDIKKTKQLSVDSADQGYDPFSPGVGGSGGNYSCEAPSDLSAGQNVELELVNQAIEAVRSEMEREKKKLSQMGDAEYEPTTASVKSRRLAAASSHQAYDPGSYQMGQASEYNPSPRSSKYTLDSENSGNSANAMEYVPTAVSKTSIKKVLPPPTSSIKNKYTLDNSKPPTDMEYDPLSNYSAKPTVKQQRTARPMGERNKRLYPTEREKHGADEEYVPTMKKPRSSSLTAAVPKYTVSFSESDGESSGTEYRPMSLSRMQRKAGVISLKPESTRANPSAQLKKQPIEESEECFSPGESDDAGPQGEERPGKTTAEKKAQCQSKLSKSAPPKKHVKELTKTIKEKRESSGTPSKSSSKDAPKVKIQSKRVDGNSKSKEKTPIKSHKEGTESKNTDKSKKLKVKGEIGLKDKDKPSGDAKNPRNEKSVKSNKVSTAFKNHKNGKVEIRSQEKDKLKCSQGSGNKEKSKKTCTVLELKEKHQSLSHADLFGAESAEEEDEQIVRKCASAVKRGRLGNKKIINSEVTSSSSEGEDGFEAMDYSCLQEELENDSDMMEECLRIFNESKEVKTEDKGRQAKQLSKEQDDEEEEDTECTLTLSGQKKRVSHYKAQGKSETSLNAAPMPQRRLTPQEICYRRMQKAQEQAAQLTAAVKTASASPSQTIGLPGEKRRVAHRPNATLSSSKPRPAGASNRVLSPTNLPVKVQTSAAIQSKTSSTSVQKRVAHTPTLKVYSDYKSSTMKRPIIPTEFGAKVPTNVRQRYLNIFIDECLKFCSSEKQAFQMALDEEKVVYDRSSSKNIYLNVAVNTLKKLRGKNTPVSPSVDSSAASVNRRAQSHEEMLGGRLAAKTSFTINRSGKQQDVNLKGAALYKKLKAYMMTDEQLQEHGYPRPHPVNSGHAVVHNLPEKKNNDPFSKICCRCGAEYKINVNGSCVRKEECNHHWGKLRRNRVPGGWETLYNCCSGAVGSPGCEVAKQHVQDGRKESLAGFMKTFSKPLTVDGNGGVYALDCEMCYTKIGLELTRVTVINADLKVVYDTFVKPGSRVVDYNTRFSGVTQEDLENTTITLRDVQAVLLNMFSAESILLGHSLESDLFSLKLIHSTVVDTAIVFPHRLGLPYKRALRNLMADHLKRIIQDSVGGHDSSEDARACMELMIWKIKEDAKVKR